jgi:hypothetical protein
MAVAQPSPSPGKKVSLRGGGVTWRAAALSLVVIAISAPVVFWGEVVWHKGTLFWSSGMPVPWPLTVLLVLTALTSIPALRRLRLTRPEMLTVYSVILVVTPLFGTYVLFYLLSQVPTFYYLGRSQPLWEPTFLHLIPSWWGPSSFAAVEDFYHGQAPIPWSEWALPLAAWSSFMISLYVANICFLSLLQKQWIRHERLTFPLAQIPLETVAEGTSRDRGARLPVSRAFWVGLVAAAAVGFLSQLSQRVPVMPAFSMQITLMSAQPVGPVAALGQVDLWLYPWLISLAYLLPKDLLFSVWFLWLVRLGLCAMAIRQGVHLTAADQWWTYDDFPAPFSQATGAVVGLSVWALWSARRHLSRALRIALSRRPSQGDRDEPLPHRWALSGFIVAAAWMIYFLVLSGCRPIVGVAYVALLLGLYLAYARLQAEAPFEVFFWWFNDIAAVSMGMRNMRPAETLTIYMMNWAGASFPGRIFSACSLNTLTSFKIADANGTNLRGLTYLLLAAFVIALGLGVFVTLTGLHHHGFLMTTAGQGDYYTGWAGWALRDAGYSTFYDIVGEDDRYVGGTLYMAAGAVICVFLGLMRLRFLWWPFHPIGYLLSNSIPLALGTFPFFIAWALKSLVIRYGGLRLYRKTIPPAIGLIMGDLLSTSVWHVITLVTCGRW